MLNANVKASSNIIDDNCTNDSIAEHFRSIYNSLYNSVEDNTLNDIKNKVNNLVNITRSHTSNVHRKPQWLNQ